jgi:predicted ArsR family transcriptional regulator
MQYNACVFRTTARQRILEYLRKEMPVSAAQISRATSISAASVRYHLRFLMSDGRIVVVGETQPRGRGRPVKLYRASERVLGDNLAMLSDALLEAWRGAVPVRSEETLLKTLAQGLMSRMRPNELEAPTARRLASLVDRLNALHYQTHWEAGAQGPRILFRHCPYAKIIDAHPELCRMDAELLSQGLDARATQVSKIDLRLEGSTHCIFVLR